MNEQEAALRRHGYNPDLPARGVSGPPGEFPGYRSTGLRVGDGLVPTMLRNHVCALDGVVIDGHSDPDRNGLCEYCSADMP